MLSKGFKGRVVGSLLLMVFGKLTLTDLPRGTVGMRELGELGVLLMGVLCSFSPAVWGNILIILWRPLLSFRRLKEIAYWDGNVLSVSLIPKL